MKGKIKIVYGGILMLVIAIVLNAIITKVNVKNSISALSAEDKMMMQYEQVTDEVESVENCSDVKFSVFFLKDLNNDGNAEKLLGTCKGISSTDQLWFSLNVQNGGTLKNGNIKIQGKNFKLKMATPKDTFVKDNVYTNDATNIPLNDIKSEDGTMLIYGYIESNVNNKDLYSANNNAIILTGTFVDEEGNEIEINKTINLTVDWYGTASTYLKASYRDIEMIDETPYTAETMIFSFELKSTGELIPSKHVAEVTIPKLYDYAPIAVEAFVGSNKMTSFQYNEETLVGSFEDEEALRNGKTYRIEVTYPKEAIEKIQTGLTLSMPIEAYVECYNNPNEEFQNPIRANSSNASATIRFKNKVTIDADYIYNIGILEAQGSQLSNSYSILSKQCLINPYSDSSNIKNLEYTTWYTWTKSSKAPLEGNTETITIAGIDEFNSEKITDYIKSKSIYFTCSNYISENGKVYVYNNETNNLIKTFTYEELMKCSRDNPYVFEEPVKEIKIVTSESSKQAGDRLGIYIKKEIDTAKFVAENTLEEAENIYALTTRANFNLEPGNKDTDYKTVRLVSEKSLVTVSAEKSSISGSDTTKNQILKIKTSKSNGLEYASWKDGVFLVKISKQILNIKINDITVDDENVEILGYETYNENGETFIKVFTKNDKPTGYTISIDCDITPDPTAASSANIDVYAENEKSKYYINSTKDEYDINGNGDTTETIGYSTMSLGLGAPNMFVSGQYVSNYKENSNEVTFSPNVAEIEKEVRKATVNIYGINRYNDMKVCDISIIGKIPFEGNTYFNGNDLKSEFTATMDSKGIVVPEDLQSKVTVYYSEKTDADTDISNANNGWKTKEQVTDFTKVRMYLIVVNDEIIRGQKLEFNYDVNIPDGLSSNEVTYTCHKVEYSVMTANGKLTGNTTNPAKLGLRIVRFYNFDMMKYKKDTTLEVKGAVFELKDIQELEEDQKTRMIISSREGRLLLENLRANQIYELKEIKAPKGYDLDSTVIKFKVEEKANGELELIILSTEGFSKDAKIEKNESGRDCLTGIIENEPQYKINILKVDNETKEPIPGVIFDVNGKNYFTDSEGKVTIEDLSVGKEYTISEKNVTGYYKIENVTFKLQKNDNGELEFVTASQDFEVTEIENTAVNAFIDVNVTINNTKIPTYTLQLVKVDEKSKEITLKDAKFQLTRHDQENSIFVTTNEDGIINLDGLYQYVEGRDITGKYTLHETEAPSGYCLMEEDITFVVSKNEQGEFVVSVENEDSLQTYKKWEKIDDNTVKMVIQNKSLFKITKTDSETGEVLANAKFVIYEIDKETGSTIDFAKGTDGEYIGTKEDEMYVLTTDEQGTITAPIRNGVYKMIEVGFPEGYEEKLTQEVFEITSNKEKIVVEEENEKVEINIVERTTTDTLEINYIEDLVDLANSVKGGNTYSDTTVKLMRTLDFNDDSSYKNASDTQYGDLNGDGSVTGIKDELTNESGSGFIGIGTDTNPFSGVFDGQNNVIKNIYISRENGENGGLFNYTKDVEIKNVGIGGKINATDYVGSLGSLCGYNNGAINLYNCYNECETKFKLNSDNYSYIGGLIGRIEYNFYNNNGVIKDANIINSYNLGKITIENNTENQHDLKVDVGGISGNVHVTNFNVKNCYNNANIENGGDVGGLFGYVSIEEKIQITECYSEKGKIISGTNGVGGLIGTAYGSHDTHGKRILSNCYNSSSIYCNYQSEYNNGEIGGIIGVTTIDELKVINCYNEGGLRGNYRTGGIIGYFSSDGGIIKNSYNSGSIIAEHEIGGIVGTGYGAIVQDSYNTGNIEGSNVDGEIGGIVGNYCKRIERCYNTGSIVVDAVNNENPSGFLVVGGIYGYGVAENFVENTNYGKIKVKVNKTDVKVGGIAGYTYSSKIEKCVNNGVIETNVQNESYDYQEVGGISASADVINCINNANITVLGKGSDGADRIAGVSVNGSVDSCTNNGDIFAEGEVFDIGGIACGSSVNKSYNTGNIKCNQTEEMSGGTYIGGISAHSTATNSYNVGNITYTSNENLNALYVYGIGSSSQNCYNAGNINIQSEKCNYVYVGGISLSSSDNSYNIGNIYCNVENITGNSYVNPIIAYGNHNVNGDHIINSYYSNKIKVVGLNTEEVTNPDPLSDDYMRSKEFYELLHNNSSEAPWKYIQGTYPILDIAATQAEKLTEIEVQNEKAEFEITAEIIENLTGAKTGGTITTKDKLESDKYKYSDIIFVENVKYNQSNTNPITITPSEGYQVSKVIVNGELVKLDYDDEGKIILGEGYFKNIDKDYNIQVSFDLIGDLVTVKKVDEDGKPLSGAEFSIEEVESREEVTNAIGELQNSDTVSSVINLNNEVQDVFGEMINIDATSYFEKQDDGTYISNNSNVGTTAHSAVKIDLTNMDSNKKYKVMTNLEINSDGSLGNQLEVFVNFDTGTSKVSSWRILKGNTATATAQSYITPNVLTGGQEYYLHYMYKISKTGTEPSFVKINNFKLYEVEEQAYGFEKVDNKYVPQNINVQGTTAISNIPVDLTNTPGKVDILFKINSKKEDANYAKLSLIDGNTSTTIFDSRDIVEDVVDGEYRITVQGEKTYNLRLEYSVINKNIYDEDYASKERIFSVEDIKFTLNSEDLLDKNIIKTNKDGIAVFPVKPGKYNIIEEKAPVGYSKTNEVFTVNVEADKDNTLTVVNKTQKKVIVHYYVKGTGPEFNNEAIKVKDDEIVLGTEGERYFTISHMEIEGYKLQRDENGGYVVPENATGIFTKEDIHVYYYYEGNYRIKTGVKTHKEATSDGQTIDVAGGTISGEGKEFYEEVEPTNSNKLEIKVTPAEGYRVLAIRINNKEIDYTNMLAQDGSVTLPSGYFKNILENKYVEAEFEKVTQAQTYKLQLVYMANEECKDGAKFNVQQDGRVIKSEYAKDGKLYIGDIKADGEGKTQFAIYEEETPKFCTPVLTKEKPGTIDVTKKISIDKAKYEVEISTNEIDKYFVELDNRTNTITVYIHADYLEKYDLSIKKFITAIDDEAIEGRSPIVKVKKDEGIIKYEQNNTLENASNNQNITYTFRMYNESTEINAKGKRIIENIPEGLVFEPENETNKKYEWKMYVKDEAGNMTETENVEEANVIATDYLLGKEIQMANFEEGKIYYLDTQIALKVDETKVGTSRIVENSVQIEKNENDDNQENDTSTERVYINYFDLDITKYIKNVVIKDSEGETSYDVGEVKKGEVFKVDVAKDRVKDTKIIVTYGLKIKNIGEIPGYATKLIDYVPEDFELVDDNWKVEGKNVTTNVLENTLIQPKESIETTVTFEWDLSKGNVGLRLNEAKILEYTNDFDAKDLTDDNKDSEPMLVEIRTGMKNYFVFIYLTIAVACIVGVVYYVRDDKKK